MAVSNEIESNLFHIAAQGGLVCALRMDVALNMFSLK